MTFSPCLEGLTAANIIFLEAHLEAIQTGQSPLPGMFGFYAGESLLKARKGKIPVFKAAVDVASVHQALFISRLIECGADVNVFPIAKVFSNRPPWLQRLEEVAPSNALEARQVVFDRKRYQTAQEQISKDLIIAKSIARSLGHYCGAVSPLYEYSEDDGYLIYWEFHPLVQMAAASLVFPNQACQIQFTPALSEPREIRDLTERQNARPVCLRAIQGSLGIHHEEVDAYGVYVHDIVHAIRASAQGPEKRLETVSLFDTFERVVGGPITLESSVTLREVADEIQTGVDAKGGRTEYQAYIVRVMRKLEDRDLAFRFGQAVISDFRSHPHLPRAATKGFKAVYG